MALDRWNGSVWLVIAAAFLGRLYVAARNRVEAHAVPL